MLVTSMLHHSVRHHYFCTAQADGSVCGNSSALDGLSVLFARHLNWGGAVKLDRAGCGDGLHVYRAVRADLKPLLEAFLRV